VNLILVGGRGSGKSTVGPLIAGRLGWQFVDLDAWIVKEAGQSIRDIFATEGEEGFRRREREACQQLKKRCNFIIALGGGSLLAPENRALMKRLGKIIWLRAPAAVLWARINRDPHTTQSRPNLTAEGGLGELEATLAQREPQYRAAAHHIVDTMTAKPEAVAEAIQLWYDANDAQSS
jgi:shikimate kinase